MYEVYFSYDPREVVLVDWKNYQDISINGNKKEKAYETLVYGKHTGWVWVYDFYPNPLANPELSLNNVLEYADMEDAIKKLFKQDS